mgnify:FL=1
MWSVYYEWEPKEGYTSYAEMSFEFEEDAEEFMSLLKHDKVTARVVLEGYSGDLEALRHIEGDK